MPLETQDKNDRDRNTLITGNSLRVQSFLGVDSRAKFGCQPIKLELYLPMHTYPANYGARAPQVASFPGRSHLQYLIAYSMPGAHNEKERLT